MSLWHSQDAALATGGKNTLSWIATGVSIDTRTIQPGDLFVALKADRDGHKFVNAAFENGAVAALVDHVPEGFDTSLPLIVVPDVMEALRGMAIFARNRFKGKVIAVTGSVGKTSTKEMLNTILTDQGKTHSSFASYNNHWGVPLTLARMPAVAMIVKRRGQPTSSVLRVIDAVRKRPNAMENDPVMLARRAI